MASNTSADRDVSPRVVTEEPIRLFFGGWLDKGHRLQRFMAMTFANEDFKLILAGDGLGDHGCIK